MRLLTSLLLLTAVWCLPALAQPSSVELYDGRRAISGKGAKLAAAEASVVKAELGRKLQHPVLKKRLEGLQATWDEFEVRDWVDGSFTRKGARQRAYLYRYSYTNGVVVTEAGKVVAHYSGDPGDYALYIAARRAPDLNKDGRDELVLVRNTEDTADVLAYVFSLDSPSAVFRGSALVFTSNLLPGEDPLPDEQIEDTAFRTVALGTKLSQQRYVRRLNGAWKAQGTPDTVQLDHSHKATLVRLDSRS